MDLEVIGRRKVESKKTKKGKTSEGTTFAYSLENEDGESATIKTSKDIMSVGDSVFIEIDKKQTKLDAGQSDKEVLQAQVKKLMKDGDVSVKLSPASPKQEKPPSDLARRIHEQAMNDPNYRKDGPIKLVKKGKKK